MLMRWAELVSRDHFITTRAGPLRQGDRGQQLSGGGLLTRELVLKAEERDTGNENYNYSSLGGKNSALQTGSRGRVKIDVYLPDDFERSRQWRDASYNSWWGEW